MHLNGRSISHPNDGCLTQEYFGSFAQINNYTPPILNIDLKQCCAKSMLFLPKYTCHAVHIMFITIVVHHNLIRYNKRYLSWEQITKTKKFVINNQYYYTNRN